MKEDFNPLPPHGGRRPPICNIFSDPVFQSTPSTRRETYWISVTLLESFSFQSTPSTRRETCRLLLSASTFAHFNPLPPHGGRPIEARVIAWLAKDFNPLPPHGGRRRRWQCRDVHIRISIHSLHTEGDLRQHRERRLHLYFNPLPPHGGRPFLSASGAHRWIFQSTPSTRRETWSTQPIRLTLSHFNPLPPHGGRPNVSKAISSPVPFQSTPSTRRETST